MKKGDLLPAFNDKLLRCRMLVKFKGRTGATDFYLMMRRTF